MTDTNITKIPCPTCRRETPWKDNPFRPFCSERCRLIDLGAWVSGEYRVAGEEQPVEEDDDE
jgi:hypothetical protein